MKALIRRLWTAQQIVRSMGLRWSIDRLKGFVASKTNALQRHLPNTAWDSIPIEISEDTFTRHSIWPIDEQAATRLEKAYPDSGLAKQFDDLIGGKQRIFGGRERVIGWPPQWHRNVDEDQSIDAENHFSAIKTFGHGDIKNFWEPARFGFVWTLCRAHFAEISERSAEFFFESLSDFCQRNPPYRGPQWMCGQEAALRALAVTAGWSIFRGQASTENTKQVIRLLVVTARRIEVHLDYALSQKNNHGLSEGLGLLIVGLSLGEHPDAERWQTLGKETLEREAAILVDADGGFSQQSANYHRVMQHVLVSAVAIAGHHQLEMPTCLNALKRSSAFLNSLVVDQGRQPRYGHDDGACVLSWTACEYDDFRPVMQEAAYASQAPLPNPPGPWDAGLVWLGASDTSAIQRSACDHPAVSIHSHAGMAVLRKEKWYTSMRVPPAKFRPGQIDALHVDVWFAGSSLAIDPGTYRYNADLHWSVIPLALGKHHNVINCGETDLAKRVGRFLYVPWPQAEIDAKLESNDGGSTMVAAKFGRSIGQIHHWHRTLRVDEKCVEVIDQVHCHRDSKIHLNWQLVDGEIQSSGKISKGAGHWVRWHTDVGLAELKVQAVLPKESCRVAMQRATATAAGWYAPRYGELAPCHSIMTAFDCADETRVQINSQFSLVSDTQRTRSEKQA